MCVLLQRLVHKIHPMHDEPSTLRNNRKKNGEKNGEKNGGDPDPDPDPNPTPTCFPVHRATGFSIAGGGMSTCSPASPRYEATRQKVSRSKKMSLWVMRYAAVKKSWVAATSGSPFLGVTRLYGTAISCRADEPAAAAAAAPTNGTGAEK